MSAFVLLDPGDEGAGTMLRVIVIDDQEQFAELVRATMGREPGFESIGHATNVADGLALIETFDPDLVTVNVHLGPSDGIASIAQITERHPNVRVVVLAALAYAPLMQRAAAANARASTPRTRARLGWHGCCATPGMRGSRCILKSWTRWPAVPRCARGREARHHRRR